MFKVISKEDFNISIQEIRDFLRIDDEYQDDILLSMFNSVMIYAEEYTGITLTKTVYKAYKNNWCDNFYIYATPVDSIDSIKYYDINNVLQTQTDFNVTYEIYPYVYSLNNPPPLMNKPQPIEITFTAGSSRCPTDLRTALKMHTLSLFENRGDDASITFIPANALVVYNKYKIVNIGGLPQKGFHYYV